MLAERYKLVVEGIEDGADLEVVKVAVSERFNLPLAQVNRLFARDQVTLRDDLDKERAWHVQRLLEDMQVRAKVIPMPLSNLKLNELTLERPFEPAVNPSFKPMATTAERTVQRVHTSAYRSRRTQVKNSPAASNWRLSTILLGAGSVVALAYLAKALSPLLM